MAFDNPIGINDPSGEYEYDAATYRRHLSALLTHDSNVLSARPGVLQGLSASVSTLTVTVQPGSAVVTPVIGAHGSYTVTLSAAEDVVLSPRDGTFGRIDRVGVIVNDPEISGSARGGELIVAEGTPSAAPQVPSLPTGVLPLWRASVPASGTVALTDERVYTASAGGMITCTSTTRPSSVAIRPGQLIFETDTGNVMVWAGSYWLTAVYPDSGWVDISSTLQSGFTSTTGLRARASQGSVEMQVDVSATGSWSTGTSDFAAGVPTMFRPDASKFAACYASGRSWIAFVRSDGTMAITNTSGSATSARCQATIAFSI